MLEIQIKTGETFNEETGEFNVVGPVLYLEHSLLSLSKWEEKYEKPFLDPKNEKSTAEVIDYIRMMVVAPDDGVDLVDKLTNENLIEIQNHITAKRTATWFSDQGAKKPPSREVQTSELIYYWMFSLRIPKECEEWHLNRLMTLIRVFSEKDKKPEKMSQKDIMARNRTLNAQRKAKYNTRG